MFLPILKNTDLFDFQKTGNYNNWKLGMIISPNDAILPFNFSVSGGNAIIIFSAKKVSINSAGTVTIESSTDLSAYVPTGTVSYERTLIAYLSQFANGIYYFYLSDGSFAVKSELFCCNGIYITSIRAYSPAYSSAYL